MRIYVIYEVTGMNHVTMKAVHTYETDDDDADL